MIDGHFCIDGAYKVALSTGKSDKLCASGSSFRSLYQACKSCIEENSEGSSQDINSYLEPKFAQFIAYCEGGDADTGGGIGGGTTACDGGLQRIYRHDRFGYQDGANIVAS